MYEVEAILVSIYEIHVRRRIDTADIGVITVYLDNV